MKLEMDWSHSPQASRQHYTTSFNLEPRGEKKKSTTEKQTRGLDIWKQTSKKWDIIEDNYRVWLRTGMPGKIMLETYALGGATKALILILI